MTPAQRRVERGSRRPVPPSEPIPALHTGHALFDQARRLQGSTRSGFKSLVHPYYDDLIGEIVLALVEGRSGIEARRAFLEAEYAWRRNAIQMHDGVEPVNGRLVYTVHDHEPR
jgi:hypothetical protein